MKFIWILIISLFFIGCTSQSYYSNTCKVTSYNDDGTVNIYKTQHIYCNNNHIYFIDENGTRIWIYGNVKVENFKLKTVVEAEENE